ncbi:MAG: DUF4097 family beta strand repeat-containing protein [Gemmatimonadaceae bacterium]
MRHYALVALAALTTIAAAAVPVEAQAGRDRDDRDDDRAGREIADRIDTTLALSRGGTVDLSLISGEIIVNGWTRNDVQLHASTEEGELQLDASPSRISLEVEDVDGDIGDTWFEISVPRGTRVLMGAVSGDITATDIAGEVEASSVSGEVQVAGAADRVTAGSVSGGVRVVRVTSASGAATAGSVRANSVSGDVWVEDAAGSVETGSVSGDITLRGIRSGSVRAKTVSGDVEYDGTFEASGRYEFGSHSGDILLAVPQGAGALLTLETFSGEIDSDFPLTIQPGDEGGGAHRRKHGFQFTLGNGGARIDVETFSGDIHLMRRGSGTGSNGR